MPDTLPPDAQSRTITYWDRMGKLNLMSGIQAIAGQKIMNREAQKNQAAESAFVRRKAWDSDETDDPLEAGDEMGDQTILGDVTHPTPIVIAGNQGGSDALKTLATMALGGILGGGGLAAGAVATYLLNRSPAVSQPTIAEPSERVEIGLRKIEDFLGEIE